ncbi:AraC family transcriptional regulator [Azoarcus olearius]|uniref:helix-turn-helix domain-containing protein n=1 Tax=Azoarcus sp. (strain BH72) TaxID=418699 RepID=UPI0008061B49|nr:helix-turn-helix domain-containing protein [Azoarcus olearius]ANQ85518.1 AraC family transcriptional regulator [Azoarcus olearius]
MLLTEEDFIFAPPAELGDCVQHGMVKTLPGGGYLLPAAMHPIFLVILRGEIRVDHPEGARCMATICLCGGTRRMLPAWAAPGTRILTLAVQPGQLRRLVDFPALTIIDDWLAFDCFLGGQERGEAARCEAALAESTDAARQTAAFLALLSALRRRRRESEGDLVLPAAHLGLAPKVLAARFGLSLRQFERRFLASYGQSLRSLRQQLRCSQVLAALVSGQPKAHSLADLAARFGYFDQSHLNRDLVRYTGYSPGQLLAGIAGDDPAFWPYRISPLEMVRLFGPAGY